MARALLGSTVAMKTLVLAFGAVLFGCSFAPALATHDAATENDASTPEVGTTDAGAPDADASTLGFLSDDVSVVDGGNVLVDDVTYRSGALVIHGVVCRPVGSGKFPLVMLDHGGFMGIDADTTTKNACTAFAELGIVAALSSYRGEDGSDGSVEVCAGEVDDVLAMKAVMLAQPYVAPRVATIGFSHGACIATMSALRDASFRAVIDFFGPADIGAAFTFWQTELESGESFCASTAQSTSTCASMHQYLVSSVLTATKGTPAQAPQAFASRSPAPTLSTLAVPIMIFQGTYDYAIPLDQACIKRSISKAHSWFLDASLDVAQSTACGGAFDTSPLPTSFPDAAYLFVYEGQGHGFDDAAEASAGKLAMPFLLSRF